MTDVSGEGAEWESSPVEERADIINLFDRRMGGVGAGGGGSDGGNGGSSGGGGEDRPQPQVITVNRDLNRMSMAVEQVLRTQNRDELFVNVGELTVIGRDNKSEPVLQGMHEAVFARWLSANAMWTNNDGDLVSPMEGAVRAVYHDMSRVAGRCGVPVVEQIATMPFFTESGKIVDAIGYCREARTWLEPAERVNVPEVPRNPGRADVEAALALILGDLLVDFPFAEEASRAHAVALLVLPFMRDMVDGPTPLHTIDAPVAGTGKGKLTKLCLLPSTGRMPSTTSFPKTDSAMEKKLTSMLMAGKRSIVFDNANGKRASELLASATTEPYWTERILGESKNVDVPIRNTWTINGNNITLSGELARRAAPWIRLDPGRVATDAQVAAKPHLRKGFKHKLIDRWAMDHVGELAWAALVLVQAWIVAGRPEWSGRPLGSYESWSLTLGGVLEHVGIGGFLSRVGQDDDAIEERDAEEELFQSWWERFGGRVVAPKDLAAAGMADAFGVEWTGNDRAMATKIGSALRVYRDRTIAGYTMKRNESARGWQLVPYEGESVDAG